MLEDNICLIQDKIFRSYVYSFILFCFDYAIKQLGSSDKNVSLGPIDCIRHIFIH